jgi:16S rRNA processing protein RimM
MTDEPPKAAAKAVRRVVLGRVLGPHGLRGGIRVRWLGDGPEDLLRLAEVALGAGPEDAAPRSFPVESAAPGRPGEVRLELRGVGDRDAAAALRGLLVMAESAALAPLPEGEYYWFQFVGCRVEDEQGRTIGTIREIWETGAVDVLVVEGEDGRRRLLPAAEDLLKEVDIEGRRIAVEAIPGLLDPV